jgi:hypothetical protein
MERRKQGAAHSFVPRHRAETAKPNVAGAASAREVNSDPRAMREEEESSDFAVRPVDGEAMKRVSRLPNTRRWDRHNRRVGCRWCQWHR